VENAKDWQRIFFQYTSYGIICTHASMEPRWEEIAIQVVLDCGSAALEPTVIDEETAAPFILVTAHDAIALAG
jgi:hypothetical protein